MSRILEGKFLLEGLVKEKFRELMASQLEFSGVRMVTFAIMSNHVHWLLEVPNAAVHRAQVDDEEILRRLGLVASEDRVIEVRQMLERLKEQSPEGAYLEYRQRFLNRMVDVSAFMQELKQCFTQWYNNRVGRKGPLWEDRFNSVLVEDDADALLTMAGYIDLNCLRSA